MSHVDAPAQYNAVHFHADDLTDCEWETDFSFHVPVDWASGVYVVSLASGDRKDDVPVIISAAGQPQGRAASLAVLLPTFSYLAYANEHVSWERPNSWSDISSLQIADVDRFVASHRLLSLYDEHRDGSGTCYSSWRRPVLNFRPNSRLALVDGPHQFSADLELLRFMDANGVCYDVLTDDDLHRFGLGALASYRAIVTGTHPEYWSAPMVHALDEYLASSGRLAYLGGNGMYWVTSTPPDTTEVVEVRRGRSGTRVWESEPGEECHGFTGERGGLWRNRGWAPQRLLGVGFTAQGFDKAVPYAWQIDETHQQAGFICRGIDTTAPLGSSGSVLGGAAGFEIDRIDERQGTPVGTVLVARASGLGDGYQGAVEDVLTADSRQGGSVSELVRSDVAFSVLPSGGAVFSVGSITWCGALSTEARDDAVAKATLNVLERFASPVPFMYFAGPAAAS
jgi:N,N-dimethylformamidase